MVRRTNSNRLNNPLRFKEMNLPQKITLLIFGYYKNNRKFFIKCKKHGITETKPCGYQQILICPKCINEMWEHEQYRKIHAIGNSRLPYHNWINNTVDDEGN